MLQGQLRVCSLRLRHICVQGSPGIIFASVMTYYRFLALSVARKLVWPDWARYDALWTEIISKDEAGVLAVEAASRRLHEHSLDHSSNNAARQYNRRQSSCSVGLDEEDCYIPGNFDQTRPVDSLDQLYAQVHLHSTCA